MTQAYACRMATHTPLHDPVYPDPHRPGVDADAMPRRKLLRPAPMPRRRMRWGTWLVPAAIGAVVAGLWVSNHYESASLGERLDATVERSEKAVRGVADGVQQSVQLSADQAARAGATGLGRAAQGLNDVGITASIKTALAADPALSALKIDVDTHNGIVTLRGPAPSADARDRATVLARAPQGVVDVLNELRLPGGAPLGSTVAADASAAPAPATPAAMPTTTTPAVPAASAP